MTIYEHAAASGLIATPQTHATWTHSLGTLDNIGQAKQSRERMQIIYHKHTMNISKPKG
jgi:hypothetical protein